MLSAIRYGLGGDSRQRWRATRSPTAGLAVAIRFDVEAGRSRFPVDERLLSACTHLPLQHPQRCLPSDASLAAPFGSGGRPRVHRLRGRRLRFDFTPLPAVDAERGHTTL